MSAIKVPRGKCVECADGVEKYLGNKKLSLCIFHERNRKQNIYAQRKKEKEAKRAGAAPDFKQPARNPVGKQSGNVVQRTTQGNADDAWYKRCWESRSHICEECDAALGDRLRRSYVSHILTKGAHTEIRNHPYNFNILCPRHHDQWEFGDRRAMKIYSKNLPFMMKYSLIK